MLTIYTGSLPGFRNWVPKIGNCKTFGCPIFQRRPEYIQITTINMYLLEIRHTILMICRGIYIWARKKQLYV